MGPKAALYGKCLSAAVSDAGKQLLASVSEKMTLKLLICSSCVIAARVRADIALLRVSVLVFLKLVRGAERLPANVAVEQPKILVILQSGTTCGTLSVPKNTGIDPVCSGTHAGRLTCSGALHRAVPRPHGGHRALVLNLRGAENDAKWRHQVRRSEQ